MCLSSDDIFGGKKMVYILCKAVNPHWDILRMFERYLQQIHFRLISKLDRCIKKVYFTFALKCKYQPIFQDWVPKHYLSIQMLRIMWPFWHRWHQRRYRFWMRKKLIKNESRFVNVYHIRFFLFFFFSFFRFSFFF